MAPGEGYSNGLYSAVGVAMGIGASALNCYGMTLQKQSMNSAGDDVPVFQQRQWIIGMSFIVCGSLIDFASFGLAPQSLLAPLAALTLIWNLLLARQYLGETFGHAELRATALIFFGTVLVVIFADHSTTTYDLDELMALYGRSWMQIYMVVVPCFIGAHYVGCRRFYRLPPEDVQDHYTFGVVCFGGLAGCVGGQSLLFAKSAVELIKSAVRGSDAFSHLSTYVIIVCMASCLVGQIKFLNEGLRQFDALHVVPVYEAYWIISGVLGGLVYFDEWSNLGDLAKFMFLVGTVTALFGIRLLTSREGRRRGSSVERGIELGLPAVRFNPLSMDDDDDDFGLGDDEFATAPAASTEPQVRSPLPPSAEAPSTAEKLAQQQHAEQLRITEAVDVADGAGGDSEGDEPKLRVSIKPAGDSAARRRGSTLSVAAPPTPRSASASPASVESSSSAADAVFGLSDV